MVLCSPTLDKRHSDGAHLGKLVDCLEAMVDRLCEECRELLIVEYLETAARGDLAHGGGVEAVVIITIARLNKDGRVRQTLRVHLATNIVEMNTLAYVSPGVLNGGVPVDVGELTQTKPADKDNYCDCCYDGCYVSPIVVFV